MRKLPEMLTGSNTVNARFGSVIVDAGDLNMDRYNGELTSMKNKQTIETDLQSISFHFI